MGRHKFGGGAVRCEVCKDKCTHQNCVVVGRKASGTARVVHKKPTCQREWKYTMNALMAEWPERREQQAEAHNTAPPPTKPAPAKRREPPPPPAAPKPLKPAPVPAQKEAAVSTTQQTTHARHVMKWKPELTAWLLEEFVKEPWRRYWSTQRYRLLRASAPDLLLDTDGHLATPEAFSKMVARLALQQDAARSAVARAAKHEPPRPVPDAPERPVSGLRLVPVPPAKEAVDKAEFQRIMKERVALGEGLRRHIEATDCVAAVVKEVILLLDTFVHGPAEMAIAAGDKLKALAELVEQR